MRSVTVLVMMNVLGMSSDSFRKYFIENFYIDVYRDDRLFSFFSLNFFYWFFLSFTSLHPNPTLPLYSPSTLATFPTTEKKNFVVDSSWCVPVYHFVYTNLLSVAHCHDLLVQCEASGFCYSYEYWNLTRSPLKYPVFGLCHGGPLVLDL